MLSPGTTGSGKSLTVIATSAVFAAMMFVLAVATLFAVYGSDVDVCVYAWLLRFVPTAPLAVRFRLNTADSFTASGVLRVHVISPAMGPEQVQPALGVVIELNVLPAGTCVTNVGLSAARGPLFVTVCVKSNALPCTTTAGTVFVIERSTCSAETTTVVVLAMLFDGVGSS